MHLIGNDFVNEFFPGRQAIIATQGDGVGQKVHNHILINDVSMLDSKGCTKDQYHYTTIERQTDEIAARYTIPDTDNLSPADIKSQAENAIEDRQAYSYKSDIKARVRNAMLLSDAEDDFINQLQAKGVNTVKRESDKYGAYYTYELTDTSAIPEGTKLPNHALKIRSYKLGSDFGPAALDKQIEFNKCFSNTSLNNDKDIGKFIETDEVFDEILSEKSSESDVFDAKDDEYTTPITEPNLYDEPADYSSIRARLLLEAEDEEEKVKIKVKEEVVSKNKK